MAPGIKQIEDSKRRMEKAGLSRVAPEILKLLRPSIRLLVGDESRDPVTRLGGAPNLPPENPWPRRASGDPLSFLAQIDLAALGACNGLALPGSGSLYFFCDAEYLPESRDPRDVADGIRVVCTESSLTEHALRKQPSGLRSDYVFKGVSLKPERDFTAPPPDEWEIERLRLTEEEELAYGELFAQVCIREEPIHRMGGYPNLVQYGVLKSAGDVDADNRRLLLQLDSDSDAGMMWGDLGKLYFVVREPDLQSLRFDKVSFEWGC